jgi:hypothetical protein
MRNKILIAAAAAFLMSGAVSAYAAPSFPEVKKDDEKKSPEAAVTGLTKSEAKDAKKNAHAAKHKAKVAEDKAKTAAKEADKAAKDASKP